jgi:hypothetical protein
MIELPPLPYGASPAYGYTEAEMRAYGEACARAALEAAAKACEDGMAACRRIADDPVTTADRKMHDGMLGGSACCVAAVRALATP